MKRSRLAAVILSRLRKSQRHALYDFGNRATVCFLMPVGVGSALADIANGNTLQPSPPEEDAIWHPTKGCTIRGAPGHPGMAHVDLLAKVFDDDGVRGYADALARWLHAKRVRVTVLRTWHEGQPMRATNGVIGRR